MLANVFDLYKKDDQIQINVNMMERIKEHEIFELCLLLIHLMLSSYVKTNASLIN